MYDLNKGVVWQSNTANTGMKRARLQNNCGGGISIIDNAGQSIYDFPFTGTTSPNPQRLVMQNDGNLVAYDSNDVALWTSVVPDLPEDKIVSIEVLEIIPIVPPFQPICDHSLASSTSLANL